MEKNPLNPDNYVRFPTDYAHPINDMKNRKKSKLDRSFIERQKRVPGYRCELGSFYYFYNDPRTSYL